MKDLHIFQEIWRWYVELDAAFHDDTLEPAGNSIDSKQAVDESVALDPDNQRVVGDLTAPFEMGLDQPSHLRRPNMSPMATLMLMTMPTWRFLGRVR